MTALPLPPAHLLTADEFAALPEDTGARYELQEGNIVMSPRPQPDHQLCIRRLSARLAEQLPDGFEVLPEVDVDLGLVAPRRPGFVRAPDLVVVTCEALLRVRADGGLIRASEVRLVIEIVSPGSGRTDTVIKHGEYADAGIGHYWIVGIEDRVTLTACHLAGEFGYVDQTMTGVVRLEEPFPTRLDLDAVR